MKVDYPKDLLDGITDDPNSWGMCCSRESAEQCAREWYDRRHKEEFRFKLICSITLITILSIIIIIFDK